MRSYHLAGGSGLAGLAIREHDVPEPGPGEALVAMRANSLSYRELMVVRGNYVLPVVPDVVPVSDGAGEVVAVGEGVSRVGVGSRVAASVFPNWLDGPFRFEVAAQLGATVDGMLTEYALLGADALVELPGHLSFEEAATLPCVAVTAWNAVTGGRRLLPGETVVTLGSGGVSLFALQFAKLLGARVIATTGSAEKVDRLRELGADEVIDSRATPRWQDAVRELTGGLGAELVVDVAGALEQALGAVALEGQVAHVGFLSAAGSAPLDPMVLFYSCASLRAIPLGSRDDFVAMNRAIETSGLRPPIDRVFGFEEAVQAYEYYESNQPFGKVVIAYDR